MFGQRPDWLASLALDSAIVERTHVMTSAPSQFAGESFHSAAGSTSMAPVSWETAAVLAQQAGVTLPIEQTDVWDRFDEAVADRQPWGRLLYRDARGQARALIALTQMSVRGFPYVWAKHGPVWLGGQPTPEEEADFRSLLVAGLRVHAPRVVFARLHACTPAPDLYELLQTMTYDRTVILDLDRPDDDAILASFKSRGRRDVRKALRNTELTFHDETQRAHEVFDELYDILEETGERDGFHALPRDVYLTMLDALGPEHVRLYVVRRHGEEALVWSLVTVWGDRATRYYAGSSAAGRRLRAADALVYKEACWLRAEGVRVYDLMGVDSERVPELAGVREFKNKFVTDGPCEVPGAWDVPVRPRLYQTLVWAMNAKHRLEHAASGVRERWDARVCCGEARAIREGQAGARRCDEAEGTRMGEAAFPLQERPGFLPVVLGGDTGAYALARELHEATGQRVRLLSPSPIEAIRLSHYIDVIEQDSRDEDQLLATLRALVAGRAPRSAVVIGNRDSLARFLAVHRADLEPEYVVPFPDVEVMDALSDKVRFAAACSELGIPTPPQVEIWPADLEDDAPQIDLAFPLIGKPADGAAWDATEFEGKRKIYEINTPEELTALWADLRRSGYSSAFLIQERIPGEDDAMRSITAYIASDGTMTMVGSARVLLEDHAPTLIGNPVAMVTQPYPELWAQAEQLLTNHGYRGFANFDIKTDPRTGQAIFFEINPRIGRNSYYMVGAGVNPVVPMLADLVDGRPGERVEARGETLYSLLPIHLIWHQLDDPALRSQVLRLARQRSVVNPLNDPSERSLKRRVLIEAQKLNYDRKFHRFRPKKVSLGARRTSSSPRP